MNKNKNQNIQGQDDLDNRDNMNTNQDYDNSQTGNLGGKVSRGDTVSDISENQDSTTGVGGTPQGFDEEDADI